MTTYPMTLEQEIASHQHRIIATPLTKEHLEATKEHFEVARGTGNAGMIQMYLMQITQGNRYQQLLAMRG